MSRHIFHYGQTWYVIQQCRPDGAQYVVGGYLTFADALRRLETLTGGVP